MRYHYEKPGIFTSMYGEVYECDHPVYNRCTLFKIGKLGLAIIQQRYDPKTKRTWWTEIDQWLDRGRFMADRLFIFTSKIHGVFQRTSR